MAQLRRHPAPRRVIGNRHSKIQNAESEKFRLQNSECRMKKQISVPFILHSEFCILNCVHHSIRRNHHASAEKPIPNSAKTAQDHATVTRFGSGLSRSCEYASSAQACGVTRLSCFICSGIRSRGIKQPLTPASTMTSSV